MAFVDRLRRRVRRTLRPETSFSTSSSFWEARYEQGGNSGAGSYGQLATFKAGVINRLVAEKGWHTVLEIGCGDGSQLELATYDSYLGVDVSAAAIALCRQRFDGRDDRRFIVLGEAPIEFCDVGLSLDVIYHLVEDAVFEQYMTALTEHAARGLILYTSDSDVYVPARAEPPHIRHRPLQWWMAEHHPEWHLTSRIANPHPWDEQDPDNTSFADFYVYER